MQRVSLMVEGQNERRRQKKREIVLFSSIVTSEAHTDCCGIAVIFKVTHTNLAQEGQHVSCPQAGKALLLQSFSTFISLSFSFLHSPSTIFFIYSNKRMPNEALFKAGLEIS